MLSAKEDTILVKVNRRIPRKLGPPLHSPPTGFTLNREPLVTTTDNSTEVSQVLRRIVGAPSHLTEVALPLALVLRACLPDPHARCSSMPTQAVS